ncbi:unnamed protein product, partial [Ectocarpus sp. 8 AP-2014]
APIDAVAIALLFPPIAEIARPSYGGFFLLGSTLVGLPASSDYARHPDCACCCCCCSRCCATGMHVGLSHAPSAAVSRSCCVVSLVRVSLCRGCFLRVICKPSLSTLRKEDCKWRDNQRQQPGCRTPQSGCSAAPQQKPRFPSRCCWEMSRHFKRVAELQSGVINAWPRSFCRILEWLFSCLSSQASSRLFMQPYTQQ